MSQETLNVEFDVEETIEREYGYEEKLLKFRNGNIRYKGIVQNNILIAILGRKYKLLPNETVEKALNSIAECGGWSRDFVKEGWKIFDCLWTPSKREGVMVVNSVDGTVALTC